MDSVTAKTFQDFVWQKAHPVQISGSRLLTSVS